MCRPSTSCPPWPRHKIAYGVALGYELVAPVTDVDPARSAARNFELFGASGGPNDLYAWGPYRDVVGKAESEVPTGEPSASSWSLDVPHLFDAVQPSIGAVPSLAYGHVSGVPNDAWLAMSVNGTIAGVAPVLDGDVVNVLLDPQYFVAGANRVEMYQIAGGGSLSLLRSTR